MMFQLPLLLAESTADSGGGMRTIGNMWPLLVGAVVVAFVLAAAVIRWLVLGFTFIRGRPLEKWPLIELAALTVTLLMLLAFVVWAIRSVT